VQKTFAVAMTAALLLPTVATSAAAQDQITFDGLIWFDRNGNATKDADEPVRANVPGVRVLDAATKQEVARASTDAAGRYSVTLPAGPEYRLETLDMLVYGNTTEPIWFRKEGGTFNFGQRGGVLTGLSYLDLNRNGARDEGEEALSPGTINGKAVDVQPDGRYALVDLPRGKYEFVVAEHRGKRVLLDGKATQTFDVGTEEPTKADFRFWKPKGDLAITAPAASPAKDVYVVGDEVDVTFQITNKGEAPEEPTFSTGSWSKATLGYSDNIEPTPGSYDEFAVKSPLLPGKSIDVKIRVRLAGTDVEDLNALVRPSKWGDDPFGDNTRRQPIKVVEKGATTEPTTTTSSSSATTAPTSTTTTTAVAKAGNKSGLASTGASPLGLLALGSVLLAAGLSAFFVARRRRS
jgi:hypothetical protein